MTTEIITKSGFDQLSEHIGHPVELVGYGKNGKPPWADLALECHDCDSVIADWVLEDTVVAPVFQRKKGVTKNGKSKTRSQTRTKLPLSKEIRRGGNQRQKPSNM